MKCIFSWRSASKWRLPEVCLLANQCSPVHKWPSCRLGVPTTLGVCSLLGSADVHCLSVSRRAFICRGACHAWVSSHAAIGRPEGWTRLVTRWQAAAPCNSRSVYGWRKRHFCSPRYAYLRMVPPSKLLSGQRGLCSQHTQQQSEAVLPPFKVEWRYVATSPYAFTACIVTSLAVPLSRAENVCCEWVSHGRKLH